MAQGYTNGFPVDNDPALAADSTVLVPSQYAVKAYVAAIAGFSLPLPVNQGGTGNTNAVDAFNALSPLSTLGDILYNDGTNDVRLAGNITTGKLFLTQTGNGSTSAAPAWGALVNADIPSALTGKTYNGLTVSTATANQIDLTNGTTTVTATFGGTLGTAAFTDATAYGDVDGPASATDNAVARYDGTTGKLIQNSAVTIDDTTGSMTFTGTSARIKGDFSNATVTNRTMFQTTTATSFTAIHAIPNGTITAGGTCSQFTMEDTNSVSGNGSIGGLALAQDTIVRLISSARGTGTVLPLGIFINGSDRFYFGTSGQFGIAGANYGTAGQPMVSGGASAAPAWSKVVLTQPATAATITVANNKTFTVNNTLTLSGTDSSTLNVGTGGTLGSAAFTASSAYEPAITTLAVNKGGTGQTTYTNGQLLIGNTTGSTLAKATLTQGTGITITNGAGSITIANSAPDQTVALTSGTGISVTGTYPNFTISASINGGTF